jgi:phosphate transport system permease protein
MISSSASSSSRRSGADRVLRGVLRASAAASGVVVLLIAAFLVLESWKALAGGPLRFFTDPSWHPSAGLYNLTPMLWGTLLCMTGAVLVATPLGILSAVFGRFYAPPRLAAAYRALVELLSGIPSVVYGLWGLTVLVPLIGAIRPPGPSLLAGIIVLAVMVFPTIALSADAALAAVPRDLSLGAAALGMSRRATIRHVVLPAAKSGLFTGVILESGRAIGETMALLMVCGNIIRVPGSLFDPVRTLTSNIALEMAYAMGEHRSALFVSGLLLLAAVVALVVLAEIVARRRAHA